jgi:hypothetical protein
MVLIDQASSAIYLYQLTTAGSTNMISYPGNSSVALQADNVNGFASTLSFWEAPVRSFDAKDTFSTLTANPFKGFGAPGNGSDGSGFGDFNFIPWSVFPCRVCRCMIAH